MLHIDKETQEPAAAQNNKEIPSLTFSGIHGILLRLWPLVHIQLRLWGPPLPDSLVGERKTAFIPAAGVKLSRFP